MRRITVAAITLLLVLFQHANAQLTVSRAAPYNAINYLVKNILLGNGVVVSNITYSGDDTAVGFFNGIHSNIGLDSGIILCNGTITDAPGPNNSPGKSYSWPNCGAYSDPDLVLLSNGPVNDAAIIQFDFIPYSDTVKFQYVFGSEEYPEFVNSYNDAFGFFLSGPGISGPYSNNAENIAVLPVTNTPVTIDSVNCNKHSNYYVCNWWDTVHYPCQVNCPTQAQMNNTTVQYDGFTVPLWAIGKVQCGKQYHIKIAICDAVDCALDSGVFLKSGSFASNGTTVSDAVSYMNNIYPGDTILYRGSCGKASIYFYRPTTNYVDTILVDTSGTATPGVDYSPIKDTLIMPIGKGNDTLNIVAFNNPSPGFKTLVLTVIQKVCGSLDTQKITIYIGNPNPIQITQPALLTCPNQGVTITPNVTGGVNNNYIYYWNPSDKTKSITIPKVLNDTVLTFKVKDVCGDSAMDSIHVNVVNSPPLKLQTKDTTVNCPAGTFNIGVGVTGGKPVYDYLWSNNATTSSISISPNNTTTYKVTVTDSCGKMAKDSVVVTVKIAPLLVNTRDTTILCSGTANLNAKVSGGGGGYTYNWNTGATTSSISVSPRRDTSYVVTVTTPCGNQSVKDTIKVTVIPPGFTLTTTPNSSVTCPNNTINLTAYASPVGNCYFYLWSNGQTTSSITVNPKATTWYKVTVKDTCCGSSQKTDSVKVTVINTPLVVTTSKNISLYCPGDTTTIWASATGGGYISYTWDHGLGNGTSYLVNPTQTTTYKVTVYDSCGNQSKTNYITVTIPVITPMVATTIPDTANVCIGDILNLLVSAQGGDGVFSYHWSPTGPFADTIFNPDSAQAYIHGYISAIYEVTVNDKCGHSATGEVRVNIRPDCNISIPNIFTPNGDPYNQYFAIKNLDLHPNSTLVIYDRWGKEMFQSNNYQNNWEGTTKSGEKVPDGVYYYILYLTNGKKYSGFVQILR